VTFKILAINTGVDPIQTQKVEVLQPTKLPETILNLLNNMGKSSHVIYSDGTTMWTCHHMAVRGSSSGYHRTPIKYHAFAAEIQ